MNADELHEVFAEWNKGELDSYLIEITSQIFAKKDEDGAPLVDKILDTAGQKGTGKWTVISALDTGQPVTLIGEVGVRALPLGAEGRARGGVEDSARAQGASRSAATARRSSKTCAGRSTARRSSPTRRATCCCAPRPRRMAGT